MPQGTKQVIVMTKAGWALLFVYLNRETRKEWERKKFCTCNSTHRFRDAHAHFHSL